MKLFIKYNTPLPSSAPAERLFSLAGNVLRPRRASLASNNFELLVFLKGNVTLLREIWSRKEKGKKGGKGKKSLRFK